MSDNNETPWERDNRVSSEMAAYNKAAMEWWTAGASQPQNNDYARQREIDEHNRYALESFGQVPVNNTAIPSVVSTLLIAGILLMIVSIATENAAILIHSSLTWLFGLANRPLPTIIANWVIYSARLTPVLLGASMLLRWLLQPFRGRTSSYGLAQKILHFVRDSLAAALISCFLITLLLSLYAIGFIRAGT